MEQMGTTKTPLSVKIHFLVFLMPSVCSLLSGNFLGYRLLDRAGPQRHSSAPLQPPLATHCTNIWNRDSMGFLLCSVSVVFIVAQHELILLCRKCVIFCIYQMVFQIPPWSSVMQNNTNSFRIETYGYVVFSFGPFFQKRQ
jgi:hypothetical protein